MQAHGKAVYIPQDIAPYSEGLSSDPVDSRLACRSGRTVGGAYCSVLNILRGLARSTRHKNHDQACIQARIGTAGTGHLDCNIRSLADIAPTADSVVLSNSEKFSGEDGGGTIRDEGSRQQNESLGSGGVGRRMNEMRFLHLGVRFEDSSAPNREAIEAVLNKAKDWFRYASNCWIIYTTKDAQTWSDRLRKVPGMEGHTSFLICEMSLGRKEKRAGWLPKEAWDWIDKDRTS